MYIPLVVQVGVRGVLVSLVRVLIRLCRGVLVRLLRRLHGVEVERSGREGWLWAVIGGMT